MHKERALLDRPLVQTVFIVVLGLLAYSNTLSVPFQFDDVPNIVENPLIRDVSNVPSFFRGGSGPFASRPLLHATDALNYYIGGMDPRGYHALNTLLHLVNALLLYLLIVVTGRHMGQGERDARLSGFLASLLFVAHPVQTEAVTYVVSRSMLFATAFYLSGTMLFYKAVTSKDRKAFYIAGLFVVSLLGMASREDFATFPMMLVLYDFFFISRFRPKEVAGHYAAYIPAFAALGYLIFLVVNNTYVRDPGLPGWGIEPAEYILTQLNVQATYLRLLVLPVNQNLDYDYPVAQTLLEFPTALSFIGYLGLLAAAVMLARKRPVASFGVLWFLVALVPASFAVAFMGLRLGNPIFEHRAYLPSAGAIAAAVWALVDLTGKNEALRRIVLSLLVAFAVVLSVASFARNDVWRSEVGLWSDAVEKAPNNALAYGNLGTAYAKEGRYDLANQYFRLQMKLHKERGHYKRRPAEGASAGKKTADMMSDALDEDMAIRQYEADIEAAPEDAHAHNMLGMLYKGKGMNEKAIAHYEEVLRLEPGNAEVHNNLANAYDIAGRTGEAIEQYEEAIRFSPGYALAHYNLGIAYYGKGQRDRARAELQRALELRPDFMQAKEALDRLK